MLDILRYESLSAAEQRSPNVRDPAQAKEIIHVFRVDTSAGDSFCGGPSQ
jgi:hypothetical protein